ncbi:hypothetical protein HPB47_002879 [Ixodes persulcatus]|uniref:Uncharacterized protein n=1 Tax=Ixodes persulcatus TaxID=34615 RepID=A0AC60PK13_IXOPE|nr:hypothetical protein HPB47_002879 [Ixodes persulcatus]
MSEVEVIEAGSSSNRKRSGVWKFFNRSCAALLICLVCGTILKTSTNTTTPFAAATAEQRNPPKSKKASMMPDFKPRLTNQSVRARGQTKKNGCFSATGLHSYTVIEELTFLVLMKCPCLSTRFLLEQRSRGL